MLVEFKIMQLKLFLIFSPFNFLPYSFISDIAKNPKQIHS